MVPNRREFVKTVASGLALAGVAASPESLSGDNGSGSARSSPSTPAAIRRCYAYAGEHRLHFRRAGAGPVLVMIHSSPGSSFSLEPLIERLAAWHTVIALDTPGYGETDGLGKEVPDIGDYATALAEAIEVLKLQRFDLYGAHTGAKIALEYAARNPGMVHRLVLNGLSMYTAAEQSDMLEHYTPSLAPQWDGGHLLRTWMMRRDMYVFWPWFERSGSARRLVDLPSPAVLHAQTVDLLRAGSDYSKGTRASILYEAAPILRRLTVPTLVVAAPGDALRAHLERLGQLPPSFEVTALPESHDPDGAIAERVHRFLGGGAEQKAPALPTVLPVQQAVRRDYVDSPVGQLLVRRSGGGSGCPLVLFHASPLSSARLESLLPVMGSDRPVVTFDNPGNGDSAPLWGHPEIQDLAKVLASSIDSLGFDEYDAFGTHTGAFIAMELAIASPKRVRHVILDGVPLFTKAESEERLARYPPPLHIEGDGTHLIWAWNFLGDQSLWWPWYDKTAKRARIGVPIPSAKSQHANFVEFIKGGTTYHLNYRAAFSYPTTSRMPMVSCPALLCAGPSDPTRAYLTTMSRLAPHNVVRTRPETSSSETMAAVADLYRRFLTDQPVPSLSN